MLSMNDCQKGEGFVMNGYTRGLAAVMAGALAVAVATPTPVLANKKEAAAVGALIGLAVGAAAASNYKNHDLSPVALGRPIQSASRHPVLSAHRRMLQIWAVFGEVDGKDLWVLRRRQ
jgi:hypothetical protein